MQATPLADATLVIPGPDDLARRAITGFLAGYTRNTRTLYTINLRMFARWLAAQGVPLLEARRVDIDLFARGMETGGYKPATINNRVSTICCFYRWCHEEELIERNPAVHMKRPKVDPESSTQGLNRHELGAVVSRSMVMGPKYHALICLLGLNGLRVSEACGISVEDLGEENQHRTVRIMGKGGKSALIPLAPRTYRAVIETVDGRHAGPLFVRKDGQRLDRNTAGRWVRTIVKKAGITKRITPHSLRHSFVTAALDAGAPLRDLSIAARHSDVRMTMRYDRARHDLDRHASYLVASFIAGAS